MTAALYTAWRYKPPGETVSKVKMAAAPSGAVRLTRYYALGKILLFVN